MFRTFALSVAVACGFVSGAVGQEKMCRCSFDEYDYSSVPSFSSDTFLTKEPYRPQKTKSGHQKQYVTEPFGAGLVQDKNQFVSDVGSLLFMFPNELELGKIKLKKGFNLNPNGRSYSLTYSGNF